MLAPRLGAQALLVGVEIEGQEPLAMAPIQAELRNGTIRFLTLSEFLVEFRLLLSTDNTGSAHFFQWAIVDSSVEMD